MKWLKHESLCVNVIGKPRKTVLQDPFHAPQNAWQHYYNVQLKCVWPYGIRRFWNFGVRLIFTTNIFCEKHRMVGKKKLTLKEGFYETFVWLRWGLYQLQAKQKRKSFDACRWAWKFTEFFFIPSSTRQRWMQRVSSTSFLRNRIQNSRNLLSWTDKKSKNIF